MQADSSRGPLPAPASAQTRCTWAAKAFCDGKLALQTSQPHDNLSLQRWPPEIPGRRRRFALDPQTS
eukprot:3879731-Pyramimonas_sp.AAC.1